MQNKKEWFDTWFDSPYYHILYKERDYAEARFFIDNLAKHLDFKPGQKVMDLACGKGRHSIYMNKKGLEVVGLDLSHKSIQEAKLKGNGTLRFYEHDMRNAFTEGGFDFVLNMFTSFGYFDTEIENQQAINNGAKALKEEGTFVLDFLNPYLVTNQLVHEEVKTIENIKFKINRKLDDKNFIIKSIQFEDSGRKYLYHEKVKAICKVDFLSYFENAGLHVHEIYGDYALNEYVENQSTRMIFIAKK